VTCRITCAECGEELWGHHERGGICVACQWTEEDERFVRDSWEAERAKPGAIDRELDE